MRTYQNIRTQTAYLLKYVYLTGNAYLRRKVKVRLNRSKSSKVRLNLQNFAWQPWLQKLKTTIKVIS